MSSFRPDLLETAHEFVPSRIGTPMAALFVATADTPASISAESSERSPLEIPGDVPSSESDAAGDQAEPRGAGEASSYSADEVEELERAAFERGVESAREEAARLALACSALEAAALDLSRAASSTLASHRDAMLALAAEIARRWLGDELRGDPARYAALIDQALAQIGEEEGTRLLLNPEDLAALASAGSTLASDWQARPGLALESDAALQPAAFRIETPTRSLDGRPETLRDRLIEALSRAVEAAPPEEPA